jgi:two-component system sensor histidine kinase UhpB
MHEAGPVDAVRNLPLYWRVVLTNGLVFVVGTAALALSPATVSSRVLLSEAVVLAVGLTVILTTNALLLRRSLAPLDRLTRKMHSVDLLRPDARLPETGTGTVADLVRSFNAMLTRLETERGTSNARALAAQEAERHRIAQELHDEVGQSLTAVLLGLKHAVDLAPAELAVELHQTQEITRATLDEVRRVARRLRPGVLDDLGLLSALAAVSTDLSTHTNVRVRRGFAPGLPPLSREAELVIYRVAQEAMTNVARHAHAGTVDISLTKQGDAVVLQISDDGRGLRDSTEGAGIRGMRERALLVGGDLSIGARTDGGTQVRLLVPVRADQ